MLRVSVPKRVPRMIGSSNPLRDESFPNFLIAQRWIIFNDLDYLKYENFQNAES